MLRSRGGWPRTRHGTPLRLVRGGRRGASATSGALDDAERAAVLGLDRPPGGPDGSGLARILAVAVPASYHLLLGHGLAVRAIRAAAPGRLQVGIVNNLSSVEAATDRPEEASSGSPTGRTHQPLVQLDPVHGRGFPADMREVYGVELPELPGDLETIAQPLDWLGLNYYFPSTVADDPSGPAPRVRTVRRLGVPRTGMDWEVDASGIERLLLRLTDD